MEKIQTILKILEELQKNILNKVDIITSDPDDRTTRIIEEEQIYKSIDNAIEDINNL